MNISLYELTSQYRRDLEHIQNSDLDEQQAIELHRWSPILWGRNPRGWLKIF